jgi:hypothetical protein
MKLFDQKINEILNETPWIKFNTNTELAGFDFEAEDYDDSTYDQFIMNAKEYYNSSDDNKKQEFIKELKHQVGNKLFLNPLKHKFPNNFGSLNDQAIVDKLIKQIIQ